ncbi:MAG: non-canonical purine NTP pyrophosphatase [Spirochaetae bacterium HGW-Spirochaetae-7]|jgi:XTP/dITP diphosphohydrolase|nr:MAG: non-canonical purine NTP pyrophosphatase [Spirochaetae bacterium HGW-Spirochaetae-7]
MTLFVATNNAHKLEEIRSAMPGFDIRCPKDARIDFDFPEDESSFLGNSTGKALALWRLLGSPVLADDSGLCVDALGGRPGVLSARYGSAPDAAPLDSGDRNSMLLAEMAGKADRNCRFVCCMTLAVTLDRVFVVQETCEGQLLDRPRGAGGFGYDPIVFLPELGRSVAELSPMEKNRVSHRGRAIARMAAVIESIERLP